MDIHQRLAIFYRRLEEAPVARNAEEALTLICSVLEAVESEFCPVPKTNPPPIAFDGRMYPPQPDNIRRQSDGSLRIRTRGHRIFIDPAGSIRIYRGRVEEFHKRGRLK